MRRDERVFVIGEDVGVYGGAFKVTKGFQEEFGEWRVIDAPLAETAIVGACTGAAMMGMRPVAEMQFADFISCGWDHLVTIAAKQHWRTGRPSRSSCAAPRAAASRAGRSTRRTRNRRSRTSPASRSRAVDAGRRQGPADPVDRDDNPVLYFEHKHLYRRIKGEVPEGDDTVASAARIARPGDDLTVVTWGAMVHTAKDAATGRGRGRTLDRGLDLRTIVPWDREAVLRLGRAHRQGCSCCTRTPAPQASAPRSRPRRRGGFENSTPGGAPDRTGHARAVLAAARAALHPTVDDVVAAVHKLYVQTAREKPVSTGTLVDVVMPQMGVSVSEGTVVRWLKQVGESVKADETIVEISTDKVDTEVPRPRPASCASCSCPKVRPWTSATSSR